MATLIRLFVTHDLKLSDECEIQAGQYHYLKNVMRLRTGDDIALFNGRDGEFITEIIEIKKKSIRARLKEKIRTQMPEPDIWLLFAPVKKHRTNIIAEKATELGASKILPIITDHTNGERVKTDRLKAKAIESAEQCRRLTVPEIEEPQILVNILNEWDKQRRLLVMDETTSYSRSNKRDIMTMSALALETGKNACDAILVGPEGGFSEIELDLLGKLPFVIKISLGVHVLRSETAAMVALALWNELIYSQIQI
jgi:16S rRNA (uracil1498-N3)-methyltransferase